MNDTLLIAIGGFFGSAVTALFQYLVARLSAKSRQEKAYDLSDKYLKLADMTADQLEERINLIAKLHNQNRIQQQEIEELKDKRAARDEQIEALKSSMTALQQQVNKDASERSDLRRKLSDLDAKYRVLWQYLLALLEHMKKHNLDPIDPPDELKSDPEIMKIVQEMKQKGTK